MRSSLKFRRPTKKVSSLILIRTRDLIELLKKFFMCFDGRHWKFVISHGFQMNFDEISNLFLLLLLWCHQYSHQLSRIKWRLTFFFNFPTFSEPIENGKNSIPIQFHSRWLFHEFKTDFRLVWNWNISGDFWFHLRWARRTFFDFEMKSNYENITMCWKMFNLNSNFSIFSDIFFTTTTSSW